MLSFSFSHLFHSLFHIYGSHKNDRWITPSAKFGCTPFYRALHAHTHFLTVTQRTDTHAQERRLFLSAHCRPAKAIDVKQEICGSSPIIIGGCQNGKSSSSDLGNFFFFLGEYTRDIIKPIFYYECVTKIH